MALSDDEKYNILADLSCGITPAEIATKRDVSYATVLRYKTEFEKAKANGKLDTILDLSKVAREQLANQVLAQTPEDMRDAVEAEMGALLKSIDMADVLKVNMQAAANKLTDRVVTLINKCESGSELHVLADTLCMLQTAFFNKNMTQVNVQNNFGQGSEPAKYSEFLSDKPQ